MRGTQFFRGSPGCSCPQSPETGLAQSPLPQMGAGLMQIGPGQCHGAVVTSSWAAAVLDVARAHWGGVVAMMLSFRKSEKTTTFLGGGPRAEGQVSSGLVACSTAPTQRPLAGKGLGVHGTRSIANAYRGRGLAGSGVSTSSKLARRAFEKGESTTCPRKHGKAKQQPDRVFTKTHHASEALQASESPKQSVGGIASTGREASSPNGWRAVLGCVRSVVHREYTW